MRNGPELQVPSQQTWDMVRRSLEFVSEGLLVDLVWYALFIYLFTLTHPCLRPSQNFPFSRRSDIPLPRGPTAPGLRFYPTHSYFHSLSSPMATSESNPQTCVCSAIDYRTLTNRIDPTNLGSPPRNSRWSEGRPDGSAVLPTLLSTSTSSWPSEPLGHLPLPKQSRDAMTGRYEIMRKICTSPL